MTAHQPPVQVTWVYALEDEPIARDLLLLARVLEKQGLVRNWACMPAPRPVAMLASGSPVPSPPGVAHTGSSPWSKGHGVGIREGVAVFLVSPAALATVPWNDLLHDTLLDRRIRTLLVLVRPIATTDLPAEARQLVTLPKDGEPIAMRRDRDDALLDVIQAVQEVAGFRRAETASITQRERVKDVLSINDIFRLNGPPTVTFVEPPRFRELQLELGTMGTGLIVEGTFHHPIHSGEDSRLRDLGFLQQLAVAGFRLILHGHVHRADAALYRYDRTAGGRRIDIVTAGTFGAPVR